MKSADWKVAVAARMKLTTTVSNRWLSEQLDMGDLRTVGRLAGECGRGSRAKAHHKRLTTQSET